jgi:hypothetical protein
VGDAVVKGVSGVTIEEAEKLGLVSADEEETVVSEAVAEEQVPVATDGEPVPTGAAAPPPAPGDGAMSKSQSKRERRRQRRRSRPHGRAR